MDLPRPLLRWTVALAAVLALTFAAQARAQCPAPPPDPTAKPPAATAPPPNAAQQPDQQAPAAPLEAAVVDAKDIVRIEPRLFRIGKPIVITIAGRRTLRSACLDGTERLTKVATRMIKSDTDEATEVTVTIPVTTSRPAGDFPGTHTILLELSKDGGKTLEEATIKSDFAVQLTKVEVVKLTRDEQSKRLRLLGSGFVPAYADQYRISTGNRLLSICWDGTKCTNTDAYSGQMFANEIILGRIGATHDISQPFVVCHDDGACSKSDPLMKDPGADLGRWVVRGVSAFITFLTAWLVFALGKRVGDKAFGVDYKWATLFLDRETMTYSLSKLQFYTWTMVAVFSYSYLYISRFWYQSWGDIPPIPSGLPGIVAIAGGAAVGAQVITNINGPKGSGALHPALGDFITTGGVVAAERVQFLVWTLIGAAGFVIATAQIDPRTLVELPSVPESILAISGVSAFGYLGGKLARNAGPVINEVMITKGADPDFKAAAGTDAAQNADVFTAAGTKVADAKAKFGALSQTSALQPTFDQARKAIDSAEKAVNAAKSPTGGTIDRKAVEDQFNASMAAAQAAAAAHTTLTTQGTALPADLTAAQGASAAANAAATAAETVLSAIPSTSTAAGSPAQPGSFRIIDLRGRTLSQDATIKISRNADSGPDDVRVSFDKLEPAPNTEEKLQKPRVVEKDEDAGEDMTLAKHLRLVIKLTATDVENLFVAKATRTITVRNPDSQAVAYKFDVPE